jgi:diguanylate cyclase (GGDEF)-like protein
VAVICIASEEIQHFAETDYLYFKICADILRSAFIIATIQGLKTQVETNYLFFYQSSPIGLCILDEMGYMMDCNKASLDILQLSRKKYLHAPFSHLLSDDDQDIFERTLKSLSPEKKTELQIQFQGDGSDSRHLLLHLVKVTATTVFVFMTDVTDKLVLAQEVSDIKADLAKVQEIAQLGDWKLDYQTGEMRWSDALYHLFGLKPQEGTSSFELFEHFIHEGDRRMFNEAVDEAIHRLKTIDTDFRFTRFDGFKRVGHMHATAEQSMETGYIRLLGTIQDITHQKQLEKELERLSFIDGLTGISNRRRFDEAIQREWQRAMRHRNSISLILCDIDHFKLYNDTYGHQSGDECLKKVAARIEKTPSRVVDLTARYGGEEFVILLPDTEKEGAIVVAENIRKNVKALGIPHSASLLTPVVTLSLGVATLIPKRNQDFTDLIKTADKALYIAKQKGRNRVESLWESN